MRNITVVIPTLNEQADLPRCLDSLSFADQIIIVDQHSTDDTIKIAKQHNCKIITTDSTDFADKRNLGDQASSNDWILSIDADVVVPKPLVAEIKSLPDQPAVYQIGRINLIWNRPILHTDWSPKDDNHIRLYHRSLGSWQNSVHELFISVTPALQLKDPLLHYNIDTVSEYIAKLNKYSTIAAASSSSFSYVKLFLFPLKEFVKRYFYKLGFLDGYHGFFLSYLQAIYQLSVNIKLATIKKTL